MGLGSLLAGGIGLGIDAISLPVQIGSNLLGLGPVFQQANAPAFGRGISNIAQDIFTRIDQMTQSNPSLGGMLARDDIAGLGTGLMANAIGLAQGIGNVLEGAFTLDASTLLAGATQFGKALVPRFGRFAGPGLTRSDQPPFSTPIGVFSQIHDGESNRNSGVSTGQAARNLADGLRPSFVAQPFLGPSAQIYRGLEFLTFEGIARIKGK